MPEFSDKSKTKLESVHIDLQILFNEVIKHEDCTVTWGLRTQEEQQILYAQGRDEPGNIITYKDGVNKRSKHQTGLAVDVVPYPELYSDKMAMIEFGNFVKGIAIMLKIYEKINHKIFWGGNWSWKDYAHYQL